MRNLLFIPGPVAVPEQVLAAMARPMINHRGPEFARLLGSLEERLKPVFGTTSEVLLLGGSGTSGLEAAIACAFSPGDRVLACPIGMFGRRFSNIARTYGLEVDVLETPFGEAQDPSALAARLRSRDGENYRGILLTQNETSTGAQNDMQTLARAIGDHPALVLVDAVSGLAASEFLMDAWRFDIVVAASQKALAAPPGLAMVAVSERAWERIERSRSPRFYLDLTRARRLAKTGETPWTPPVSIAFALHAALEAYVDAGPAKVWARHERYARAIHAAAHAMGLELFSQPGAHSNTVVAIRVPPGVDAASVTRRLREQYGVVLSGGQEELKGTIWRIGTMGDISEVDVVGALAALESVLRECGCQREIGTATGAAQTVFAEPPGPRTALAV
ncbi:MAG: alanine--glyoxylate aminotransferase family protein [Candidatus Eremiobacteraeota bacterium]|nr:alanine--glyoxylate aminotransferase family protein [Candidatus Eremiobacteraeota bacterium]